MYLVLLMQVSTGVVIYVGLSIIFRVEIFRYLLGAIKEFLHKGKKGKAN